MATQNGFLGLTIPSMDDAPNAEVLFENFRILENNAQEVAERYATQEYVDNLVGELETVTAEIKATLGVE